VRVGVCAPVGECNSREWHLSSLRELCAGQPK